MPVGGGLFALVVLIGAGPLGHLEHFLGFVFGAAVEAIDVLSEKELARFREKRRGGGRDLLHER